MAFLRIETNPMRQILRSSISGLATIPVLVILLSACSDTPRSDSNIRAITQVYTHFSPRTELFVEFPPLVTGEKSTFTAHFTRLSDYKPVTSGTVDVVLSGGDAPNERFRVASPRAPGIFAPTAVPRATGIRNLSIVLTTEAGETLHDLGEVTIHPDRTTAAAAGAAPGFVQGEIGYFKEQQWLADFAVEQVQTRQLQESVVAAATVRASAEGTAEIAAPTAGIIRAAGSFPTLGRTVVRGQTLVLLAPRLGAGTDVASLRASLSATQSARVLADADAARMQRLFAQQAVSQRRLDEALAAQRVARAELDAAQQRLAQLGGGHGGLAIKTPIGGTLARIGVANGSAVDEGDLLFHVVDRHELWLEAHVSETDAARLSRPGGITFEIPGIEESIVIRDGDNGRLIGVSSVIDPTTRSVQVLFALENPDPRLILNQSVQARVFTGTTRSAMSVPATAVIDDGGQRVVYVMRGGESFSRIPVRLGLRDADRFEVLDGLEPGDRVVSRGAMLIRLAAATPEAMGHGHAH